MVNTDTINVSVMLKIKQMISKQRKERSKISKNLDSEGKFEFCLNSHEKLSRKPFVHRFRGQLSLASTYFSSHHYIRKLENTNAQGLRQLFVQVQLM